MGFGVQRDIDLTISGGTDAGTHTRRVLVLDESVSTRDRTALLPEFVPTVPTLANTGLTGADEYTIRADGTGDYTSVEAFLVACESDSVLAATPVILTVRSTDTFNTAISLGTFNGNTRSAGLVLDGRHTAWMLIRPDTHASLPSVDSASLHTTPDLSARVDPSDTSNMWVVQRPVNQEYAVAVRHDAQNYWIQGLHVADQTSGVGSVPYGVIFENPTVSEIASEIHLQQVLVDGQGPVVAGNNKFANGVLVSSDNFTITDSSVIGMDQDGRETHNIWLGLGNGFLVRNCHTNAGSIPMTIGFTYPLNAGRNPRNWTIEFSDFYRSSSVEQHASKGGVEVKNGILGLVQCNVVRGGRWSSGDQNNMQALGIKGAGSPHAGQSGAISITYRFNIVYDYIQGGYILNSGTTGAKIRGCHHISYHDNLHHRMCSEAAGYVLSGSPDSQRRLFKIGPSIDEFGHRGPDSISHEGNTYVAGDDQCHFGISGVGANSNWNADGSAGRSTVVDSLFPRAASQGVQGDSSVEGCNSGPMGDMEEYQYNVHPAAPAADYPTLTWRPSGSTFRTTYLDANLKLNATAIAALEAEYGVGGGGKIASGRTYLKPDGTTGTRTTPEADIDEIISLLGDINGSSIITVSPVAY